MLPSPAPQVRTALIAVLAALLVAPVGRIAAQEEGRLPVRVVGGRLVVRCEASTRLRRLPFNLFIDYDRPCGLELHNRAADGLKVDTNGGLPITLHFGGYEITVPRREHGDEDLLNDFTRLYSKELGETACVGTIGGSLLSKYHITFDIPSGFVYLAAEKPRTGEPPEEVEGSIWTPITVVNDQVWLPVGLEGGGAAALSVGTSRYDTVVDEMICDAQGKPAGDIGFVRVKTMDLHRFVAMRPAEVVLVHPDVALGTTGLNLLENLRLEVDRVNRYARITPLKEPRFPTEDLEFFKAMMKEETGPLVQWLEKHPKARLSREAAELVLDLLIDEQADAAAFADAVRWMNDTRIEDLRTTEALDTMKTLLEAKRPEVAIMAGELGVGSGRKDRYPESIHRLHARLGELLLDEKAGRKAWEHLLSAAFGLPQDGIINLNLGRFYESEKRYRRAMSRYIQAVTQPESGPQAVEALERLQPKMSGEALSVDVIDRMVQGKVYNFEAATRFEPDEETTNRVVLVELFTNPHLGRKFGEQWRSIGVGGAMALEGLLSHFPRQHLVVLNHHLGVPEPSPLMTDLSEHAAARYGADPNVMVIDGRRRGPGAALWRDAEKAFEENRRLVVEELGTAPDLSITGSVQLENGVVSGKVTVEGSATPEDRVEIILAERGVLCPGKSLVVVHRMVARGALTDSLDGVPYRPQDGKMEISFSRKLADVTKANEAWLDRYQNEGRGTTSKLSSRIDPDQVVVVAYVRDRASGEVLQALYLDPNEGKTR